jgi:hypothetical protein
MKPWPWLNAAGLTWLSGIWTQQRLLCRFEGEGSMTFFFQIYIILGLISGLYLAALPGYLLALRMALSDWSESRVISCLTIAFLFFWPGMLYAAYQDGWI